MPVKQLIPYSFGTFFITFTCIRWIPLIEKSDGYDIVYKWFDYLKSQGHFINGYVIMPNHVHVMITFKQTTQSINTIIGNGKRFMAYEIVKKLELSGELKLLLFLQGKVTETEIKKNKKHVIWELSFDWKACFSDKFIDQKLNYMHRNPCVGKWQLCNSAGEYLHSSCRYYETGEHGIYKTDHIGLMKDIRLIP